MATKIRKLIYIHQDCFTKLYVWFCPDCFSWCVLIDDLCLLCADYNAGLVHVLLKTFTICCN